MEHVALGLIVFALWWGAVGAVYWLLLRKAFRDIDNLDTKQRLELLKTRRQRYLK